MDRNPHYETEIRPRKAAAPRRGGSEGEIPGLPEMEPPARLYTIREIAREFQITIRALRFYEDRGLLRPKREGSVRRYDDRDRLHLKMILKGKQLGFTLAEIYDIVAGRSEENGNVELELKLTAPQIAAQISHLEQQRSQLEEAIATLLEAQRRLLEVPQSSEKPPDESDP